MLYHSVTWSIGDETLHHVFGSSARTNPGLRHLRELTLGPMAVSRDVACVNTFFAKLKYFLEPHTLEKISSEFRFPKLGDKDDEVRGFQREMQTTLVRRTLPNKESLAQPFMFDWWLLDWYNVLMEGRTEGIFWLDEDETGCSRRIVVQRERGKISALEATHAGWPEGWDDFTDMVMTGQTLIGLVGFCRGCTRSAGQVAVRCQCMNESELRTLNLRESNFENLFQVIRLLWDRRAPFAPAEAAVVPCLENLTKLILQDCSYCLEMLHGLAHNVAHLALKNLTIVASRESVTGAMTFGSTLERILDKVDGLRTLVVMTTQATKPPKISALTRHSKTLKELLVDVSNGEPGYTRQSVWELCRACGELEQLAIMLPPINLQNLGQVRRRPKVLEDLQRFWQYIQPLAKLPKLKTMRTMNRVGMTFRSEESIRLQARADHLVADVLRVFHDAE